MSTPPVSARILGSIVALALTCAACADLGTTAAEATDPSGGAAIAETTATTTEPTGDPGAGALLGTTSIGDVLVGDDGRSLYGFANDTQAASTCYGTCAEDWPPVLVGPDWIVGPRLDSGIFATTVRDDGQLQLVAGKWPLYFYAGDGAPGDVNGHGAGDVWFLVDPAGSLLEPAGEAEPTTEPAPEPEPNPETDRAPTAEGY
ncbi:MAG: COG4315 family predicted lipoprotein [Acidimicrobiales bacterium]